MSSNRVRGGGKGALLGACFSIPQAVLVARTITGSDRWWIVLLPSLAAVCGAAAGVFAARVKTHRLPRVFAISLAMYLTSAVVFSCVTVLGTAVTTLSAAPARFRRWESVPLLLLEFAVFGVLVALKGLWLNGIPLLAFTFFLERWTRPPLSDPRRDLRI